MCSSDLIRKDELLPAASLALKRKFASRSPPLDRNLQFSDPPPSIEEEGTGCSTRRYSGGGGGEGKNGFPKTFQKKPKKGVDKREGMWYYN